MKAAILSIIGFLLFLFGMLAMVFYLIGAKLSFLAWIDAAGRTIGLVIRLIMIFGGIILVYLGRLTPSNH